MEWIEKDRAQLAGILEEMDIPEMRKDIKRSETENTRRLRKPSES